MVCKLPSARSLSKASREGDLRENMANADMSASVKEMSVSLRRSSRMLAKPLRTKRKSASAERCWRPLGAIIDMSTPDMWTSNRFREGGIFALMFTKRQPEWRGGYWGLSLSGNCCLQFHVTDAGQPGQRTTPVGQLLPDEPVEGGVPFSSNGLRECILAGAERIGWRQRHQPNGTATGSLRRGMGMAMGIYKG